MKTLRKIVTLEHFVDAVMAVFAIASVGNISEYMVGHNHNVFTAYGVGSALGFGLVAISVLLARIPPSKSGTFVFMLLATVAVGLLSGAVQSNAYLEHRPDDRFTAYLFGFGFPLIGECLLAVAMSVYTEAQRKKRMNASDEALNERINQYMSEAMSNVDLTKMTAHLEQKVTQIVKSKIDSVAAQRLAQNAVGRIVEEVGRTDTETSGKMDHITTKNTEKLGEANEAKQRKVCERREAIVRIITAVGTMGAPELVEKLGEDCGIKASPQTVRDDCAALVDEGRLIVVGRKWDVPRITTVQQPEEIEFSTNGHSE